MSRVRIKQAIIEIRRTDRDEHLRSQKANIMTKSPATPKSESNDEPRGDRLQKILAQAGIASRRKAEELILEGRVQVNGAVVNTLGTRHDATRDHIRVDGKLLHGPEQQRYYMLISRVAMSPHSMIRRSAPPSCS